VVADLDGDGAPDLLVPDGQDIAVLRDIGSGYFDPPTFVNGASLGYNPTPFAVADMNSDGRLDITAPNYATGGNSFLIFINQTPQACKYAVKPVNISFPSAGGTGKLNVTAASSCTWTAVSNEPWITFTGGATGAGNGAVNYTVAANTDVTREGAIAVAEQSVAVTQATGQVPLQFGAPTSISLGSATPSLVW
jgi:hypothetical protein